ncbi:hypothetical protein BDP27DRAFT_54986 [Rhodocollybia butyracea]|uniref:Uncharacterized protein n=1 Tax=Rhodocollybia butyracea TaxID=206335 RepID=A0A9P5PGX5_9AGAR|nr:hypothetical protein BDP27DRAFT_54986 [Rhodocollybia butyracea]
MSQGVDIQLKILQTLLGLITNYLDVHDVLLGDALCLFQATRIKNCGSLQYGSGDITTTRHGGNGQDGRRGSQRC